MAPTLIRSVVVDDILTLNFSDVLRSGLQIDPSKFEVYGNSRIVPVDEVTVDSANAKVELTLSKSVDINDDVKVSYYDLASDQNLSVLEDESGYDVATFVNSNVKKRIFSSGRTRSYSGRSLRKQSNSGL